MNNFFVQQTNGGGGAAQAQASSLSSYSNVPIADLRRNNRSRSNLYGGSAMASAASNDQRVKLERVIGMTVNSVAALACDSVNGLIAYPAGCTVVLYSSKRNRQAHIINPARKNITCVAFSPDGNHLAAAECGHQPSVRVWDVEERTQLVELQQGHNFGVSCLMFSPDSKYLISVGNQHDNVVNVWNWRNGRKSSSNKVSCKVKAISFAEDGSYFVTVGVRHVKFWYLERSKTTTPKYQDTMPLQGRSAILSDQRNNYFCDVVCGRGAIASKTFAITQSGLLCEFNSKRLLEKWLDLKTRCAYSLALSGEHVFVGCADGTIHVFKSNGLSYVATLPRPHCLGIDIASASLNAGKYAKYPDAVAMRYDEQRKKLTCVYNDHSMYQWEIGDDFKRVGKSFSSLAHGGCIWSIETYPLSAQLLPPGTFFTGGSDDTIRMWNIDPNMPTDTTVIRKNIYSQELLKIIYADPQLAHLCDTELALEKPENQYDGKSGIRALKTSPNGEHLATGDRSGNLRIYSVADFSLLYQLSAHDSEVLCLEYSSIRTGSYFLASSSRDRLLHVLDPTRNYEPVSTIDDHSSSITSVKFARGFFNAIRNNQAQDSVEPDEQNQEDLIMLSGGADKSIIIRKMVPDQNGQQQFVRANYVMPNSTVYDMDIDYQRNIVLAACQDRQIRTYHIGDGKPDRSFKGSSTEDNTGTLIKLELDPSCTYVATSTSDKLTYIIDSRNGEFIAAIIGHGELVTGLKFTNDCRHLITVSGDGCIFVWRLASELTNRMLARLTRMGKAGSRPSDVSLSSDGRDVGQEESGVDSGRRADSTEEEGVGMKATSASASDPYQPPRPARAKWDTTRGVRPEPDGLESTEGHPSARGPSIVVNQGQDHDYVAPAGSVQKILKQFEGDTMKKGRGAGYDGGGDFGSLMNVRLIGIDDDDDGRQSKKENVVYYPPVATNSGQNSACTSNDEAPTSKDFVVKERSTMGSKPYRGAETMGDMSDEETSGTASSVDMASSSLRASESVGELHPQRHRMVVDAINFEKLETPVSQSEPSDANQSFQRNGSGRQSITSRYLQRSSNPAPEQPQRGRWNTNHSPVVPAPVFMTPSPHQPSKDAGTVRRSAANEKNSLIDEDTAAKAKLLSTASKLHDRRKTFNEFDRHTLSTVAKRQTGDAAYGGGDYALSDLHHRSRSGTRTGTSPTRYSVTPSKPDAGRDSDSSEFSGSGYRQRRKPPMSYFNTSTNLVASRSMSSLHSYASAASSSSNYQTPQGNTGSALKRLTDMREKLRKSQENIAFGAAVSGATTPVEPNSPFGDWNQNGAMTGTRSKSFGNLVYAANLENNSAAQRKTSTPMKGDGGSKLRDLLQSRGIALSSGNLGDQSTVTTPEDGNARQRLPSTGLGNSTSNLVGAIMDFKKRSNTDLSQATLTNEDRAESVAGSFYGKVTTMPRRHQATSGVGKKAQAIRQQQRFSTAATDRMSVSGESEDSSSIDFYSGPKLNTSAPAPMMTRSQIITPSMRQRLDIMTDANSSRSSSPGGGHLQQQQQKAYDAARQIFEAKQRQSQVNLHTTPPTMTSQQKGAAGKPVSSYLAKIINAVDGDEQQSSGFQSGSGAGNPNYFAGGGRHQSEGSALNAKRMSAAAMASGHGAGNGQQMGRDRLSSIVDSCDNHFDKMSGHCKDSVNQFRTSLDKVLQAHNMVIDDTDLTEEERDELLRMLSLELEAARERLSHALTQQRSASSLAARRYEPDGGRDDRSPLTGGRRQSSQGPTSQQHAAGPAISPNGGGSERDASVLLQEYSEMLVTLIQQKMSSGK